MGEPGHNTRSHYYLNKNFPTYFLSLNFPSKSAPYLTLKQLTTPGQPWWQNDSATQTYFEKKIPPIFTVTRTTLRKENLSPLSN